LNGDGKAKVDKGTVKPETAINGAKPATGPRKSKGKEKEEISTDSLKTTKSKKPRVSNATSTLANSSDTKAKPKPEAKTEVEIKAIASSPSLSPPPALPPGPKPHDPKKKQRPSHVFSFSSDSTLTEPEVGGPSVKPAKAVKAKDDLEKTTKKSAEKVVNGTGKGKVNGKEEKGKGKGKAKEAKDGEKKVRAKPVKKPEVPVDPPVFEKVDTRLGRIEAEHRMMVCLTWSAKLTSSCENIYVVSEQSCLSRTDHYLRWTISTDHPPMPVCGCLLELCLTSSRKTWNKAMRMKRYVRPQRGG